MVMHLVSRNATKVNPRCSSHNCGSCFGALCILSLTSINILQGAYLSMGNEGLEPPTPQLSNNTDTNFNISVLFFTTITDKFSLW
jgi:hypothetical protein